MCCERVSLLTVLLVLFSIPAWAANTRLDLNTKAIKTGGVYFATTEAEVVNAQSNSAITQVVNTAPWSMTANRTLTKPLRCDGGAIITTTGYTLTLSGGFEAGDYQVFSGTGTVAGIKSARPEWWGADPSGSTDSTSAVQSAVTTAESNGAEVIFKASGTYDIKMIFITTGGIKLLGNGCTLVQNHDSTHSVTVGGAGQYKVSSAFFLERDSSDVEISGFNFTTDDTSFPALASGFGSYFASIAGQHSDNVSIHNNKFSGGQNRALFLQAGKNIRFDYNDLSNNGITIHIGYTGNAYFYDSSSDLTNKYSPVDVSVFGNHFDGYTATDPSTVVSLSGANRFTVKDNKIVNVNEATTLRGIYIYSNDYGPYDEDGTALSVLDGIVSENKIEGTFFTAIQIDGDSTSATATWTGSYKMHVQSFGNHINGTGHGIRLVSSRGAKVLDNFILVSGSPLYFYKKVDNVQILNNHVESTSSGYQLHTVYANWEANCSNFTFSGNKVITPSADQYAFRATNNINNFNMSNNFFDFNSDVASCRPIVLTLGSKSEIYNNQFDIDTDTASVFVIVLTGNSNSGVVNITGNSLVGASGTGAATLRFVNAANFKYVRIVNNDTGGPLLVEDCDMVYISGNTVIMPASNTLRGIYCDNTGYSAKALVEIHSNYVLNGSVLNVPGIAIASNDDATNNTLSKVSMNRVEGNSTGSLLQQTTHGVIETLGNTIINNGSGGTSISVTGSASNSAL